MNITYTDSGRGTATVEPGRAGGHVLVLRRGFPVAAEVTGGIPLGHLTPGILSALNLSADSVAEVVEAAGSLQRRFGYATAGE